MNNNAIFQQFGIGGTESSTVLPDGTVIYTRVSSKEQAENNDSLETQLKGCTHLTQTFSGDIVESFGGIAESAKAGSPRKEFHRMMKWIRRNKNRIGHLVVYSPDRFAREMELGIKYLKELRQMNIRFHTVLQDADESTTNGKFIRMIQMAVGEMDNDTRREKCVAGTVHRLNKGRYCGIAPFGYENITRNGEKTILPTEDAVFIRSAFEMKAYERLHNQQIVDRLYAMGCKKLYKQRLTDVFRNPVYCGMLRHKLLEGRVIKGVHKGIVSKELFLMANELQKQQPQGWKKDPENANIPLKTFLQCSKCGEPFTGYVVKAKGLYYYKCNTIGCRVNTSAKKRNEDFRKIISHFVLDEQWRELAKRELLATFAEAEKEKVERMNMLRQNRMDIDRKQERLEDRFIEEEIEKPMFLKHREKYRARIREIDAEIEKAGEILSNRDEIINYATEIAANLGLLWDSGSFKLCQSVQGMVFPEGMTYDKEKDIYRTPRVNSIFAVFAEISPKNKQKKKGQPLQFAKLSHCVPGGGLEPPRHR